MTSRPAAERTRTGSPMRCVSRALQPKSCLPEDAAAVAEAFAAKLKESGVRVTLWDERLTTKEAESKLKKRGMKGRARRAVVDKVAAQVLLQSYLDTKRPSQ